MRKTKASQLRLQAHVRNRKRTFIKLVDAESYNYLRFM